MKRRRKKRPDLATGKKKENSFFPSVQKKIAIGKSDDSFEKEADMVADKVVNKSGPHGAIQKMGEVNEEIQEKPLASSISSIQKMDKPVEEEAVQKAEQEEDSIQKMEEEEPVQKAEKEEEPIQKAEKEEEPLQKMEEEEVQAKANNNNRTSAGPTIESKLSESSGKGNKMDAATQSEMEAGFGADFSNVNVHVDSSAVAMSEQLGAQAFTHGNDIYFNEGKFDPDTNSGKHLLAHELTHTIQQTKHIRRNENEENPLDRNLQSNLLAGNPTLENCLDAITASYVRYGQRSEAVRLVQQALMDLGFSLPKFGADGIYLNETLKAITQFQSAQNLGVDGIVGTLTIDRLDQLEASLTNPPAVVPVPLPEIPPPANTCTVTDENEATLAENIQSKHNSSPDVQTKHLTIKESMDTFSEKINSDNTNDLPVTSHGQFYWSSVITEKIGKIVQDNTTSMLDPLITEFSELVIAGLNNNQVEVQKKKKEILEKLSKRSGSSVENLRKLLVSSNQGTTALSLWTKFNKENKVPKEVDSLVNFIDWLRIRNEEKNACWNVANFMINRFKSRGGHASVDPDKKRNPQNKVFAGISKGAMRHFEWINNRTKGDVVSYGKGLGSTVSKIKKAIDDGFLIHARVVSGSNFGLGLHSELLASKTMQSPPKSKPVTGQAEHSLVIIGYDGNQFVFWDPDSSVSTFKGEVGFGSLFFQSDRLTTAEKDSDLFINDEGEHSNGNKRYQILSLVSG